MNDVDASDLKELENVIFITSTAGQGDFPRNAKDFYKALDELAPGSLSGLNYCVFGLGDHSYVHFNQAAKNLEAKLHSLGGECLLPLGLGDDRDEEKYETKYYEWLPSLYEKMHAEKVVKDFPRSIPSSSQKPRRTNSNRSNLFAAICFLSSR